MMNANSVKKVASFIWPVVTKVDSTRNGTLEICWYNGKKMLNSKNANYSYGKLEKALIFGLSQLRIDREAPILILGLGGGSIIRPLRSKFACTGMITAVEWDEVVLSLAQNEFGINSSLRVKKVCADAYLYVKDCKNKYGLVIVDLFIDTEVPEVFYSMEFWESIIPLVSGGGSILFNAGIDKRGDERIRKVKSFLKKVAAVRVLENVERNNTLLLAECD